MPPKGLSLDEKRRRLEQIFYESRDFYQLKELEKLGSKRHIVMQTVKEVLQSLVDDGVVHCEKIGTSNYYWSFPSQSKRSREALIVKLEQEIQQLELKIGELCSTIEEEKKLRARPEDPNENNEYTVETLTSLQEKINNLQEEIQKQKRLDPAAVKTQKMETRRYLEAANMWTDQIHTLFAFCRDMGADVKQLREYCDIPEDLDDVQLPVENAVNKST
ncbi:meiosis specific coiled-coil protein Mcp7 [Schizosaccharomyces japonicus yFS275]|uniref:Meiosis specific coiled-coil protein Mcp7 n=1 Tax=Schizosaccharomyces japonicus (strain yFS275 / FY16936) TaxID=402676 RepID=B6K2V1_SCHJY|nr:meiosis specific coiled-coil protein Mcp7 [Schizosaccharomyces japonicus yFS275]EEB08591.1 meiosis specific coiled-coil protein Mcp7 [Schizosaccharomyces japonicus yFS275]